MGSSATLLFLLTIKPNKSGRWGVHQLNRAASCIVHQRSNPEEDGERHAHQQAFTCSSYWRGLVGVHRIDTG
jgi:hypothetical protein